MNKKLLLLLSAVLVPLLALAVACGDDDGGEDVGDDDDTGSSTCADPDGPAPEVTLKSYTAAPEITIDAAKTYTAIIHTEKGDITVNLRPDLAPQHVNSFVFLARDCYFDGVTFHRVIPDFVAQAGDPTGSGSGGPGYVIPGEFSDPSVAKFERGTLGMARTTDPNSAGSQWFINYAATPSLDGAYTIFGEVTDGMDVVDSLTPRDPSQNPNLPPGDKIVTITIEES